jgi:hypothetical protein
MVLFLKLQLLPKPWMIGLKSAFQLSPRHAHSRPSGKSSIFSMTLNCALLARGLRSTSCRDALIDFLGYQRITGLLGLLRAGVSAASPAS